MAVMDRLSEDDLARMAARTQTLLSPEGAQSWHKLDVTALLTELRLVLGELAQARQRFVDDGVSDQGSLPDLADTWKAQATGVYEKKVNQRLREETRAARKAQLEATSQAVEAQEKAASLINALSEERSETLRLQQRVVEMHNNAKQALADEQAKVDQALQEIARLETELREAREQAQQQLTMAEALNAERRAEVCERAREILVLVGGHGRD